MLYRLEPSHPTRRNLRGMHAIVILAAWAVGLLIAGSLEHDWMLDFAVIFAVGVVASAIFVVIYGSYAEEKALAEMGHAS